MSLLSLVRAQLKCTIQTPNKLLLASHLVIKLNKLFYGYFMIFDNSGTTVTSLAYSVNGRHLCAGLESGTIQVFNLSSKAQQFALETQKVNYLYNYHKILFLVDAVSDYLYGIFSGQSHFGCWNLRRKY